jgi:hypothetical protein
MRRAAILAALMFAACSPSPPTPTPSPIASPSVSPSASPSPSPGGDCQGFQHVYNPQRLTIYSPCEHVAGIVEIIRTEADGDYHILVHVDPGQVDPHGGVWINACNISCINGAEHGDLVTEPVCEHNVTQSDAVTACAGYTNPAKIPALGSHVLVSGPWVLDTAHGWLELHPATYQVLAAVAEPGGMD